MIRDNPHTNRQKGMHVMADLQSRLQICCDGLMNTEIAEMTSISSESVHRYLNGSAPSIEFITRLAVHTGTSLQWLLLGEGPQYACTLEEWYVARSSTAALTHELERRITALLDKLERIDRFINLSSIASQSIGSTYDFTR